MSHDVIIIGGGAAGLFCARTAGLRGRRVLVLEHNARLGNKILISGGGRCNFTNMGATAANYLTQGSPHFPKSALARFTPRDFLNLVERHGIAWHEKKLGQLFCDHSSRQIVQLLESECADAGVEIRLGTPVLEVQRLGEDPAPDNLTPTTGDDARWSIATSAGTFQCASLVVATGGLSFPKLGTTPFGYEIARQFGLRLITPRPGLVPLTLGGPDLTELTPLSGLSIDCELRAEGDTPTFRENLLFTHRGLSGPAVLQASSYWSPGQSIHINLLPGRSSLEWLESQRTGGREFKTLLRTILPERLVQAWSRRHAPQRPLGQLPRAELESLARNLSDWVLRPSGDEGYPKAEVTLGGVDTGELSSKTLESRRVPGLYFVGEVVDVTGWLGGYNFQWAWASGHAAGSFA